MTPAPVPVRRKPTLRSRLQTFAIIVVAASLVAVGLRTVFKTADIVSVSFGLMGIFTAHLVFFEVMVEGLNAATSRLRLGLNLASYVVFTGILIITYAAMFAEIGLKTANGATHDFGDALFFAVVTWTTVGYGDLTASEPLARVFAGLAALNGYVVMAVLVAVLVATFDKMSRSNGPGA